jgi:non-ribosomal peptide synthetase component F
LAYLLFTSGTTGDPKGVPISHQNVTAFLAANLDHYQFGPGDRCSQTFDLTFDLSVFDLFMALGSGACLYPLSSTDLLSPVDAVAERGLSIWFSVPAVAALQRQRGALRPGVMPSLRASLFCGEALSVEVANAWSEAAPNSIGENLYGPTELTIACTRHRFSSIDRQSDHQLSPGGLVPIGRFPVSTSPSLDWTERQ